MRAEELAAVPLTRRGIADLARQLPDDAALVTQLSAWASERRGDAFVRGTLAALHAGRPLPASLLVEGASLLDDPLFIAAAAGRCVGDVPAALVAACEDSRLTEPWLEVVCVFLAAYLCQREGREPPVGLLRWARVAARDADDDDALAACAAVAGWLGEPGLQQLVADIAGADWDATIAATSEWLIGALTGDPLAVVPELAAAPPRVGPKVGRNDACPCGSGKKFKKCCDGKAAPAAAHDLAEADLIDRPMWELAGWPLERVPERLRLRWCEALVSGGEFTAARRAVSALAPDDRAWLLEQMAVRLATLGRVELARDVAEALPHPVPVVVARDATPAKAAKALERLAFAALDDPMAAGTVALGLLHSPFPALGVLAARGAIAALPDDVAGSLVTAIEHRRDELLWPPFEAASEWRPASAAPRRSGEIDAMKKELEKTQSARRSAEQAFARTERERARLESEAARARQQLASAAAPSVDAAELRGLREELRSLKAEHKAIHDERNALRREVAQWREQAEPEPEGSPDDEVDELDADEPSAAVAPAPLRLPEWTDGFRERLDALPAATGRAALARLGELCSGRPTGWRETKPLQGFENVWRVKIGRSYRMLFRVHDDRLHVLDVVHRQDLEKRLHQLHALR